MRQLFINGEKSQMFFTNTINNGRILHWIRENFSRFDLNEEHSCTAIAEIKENNFLIRGDEDRVELELKTVKPIL